MSNQPKGADTLTACGTCGMAVDPAEFHPYAACLMFLGCHDGSAVRANLSDLRGATAPKPACAYCKLVLKGSQWTCWLHGRGAAPESTGTSEPKNKEIEK